MLVRIHKADRQLAVYDHQGQLLWQAPVALGPDPLGPKRAQGDGKTPEGVYTLCMTKSKGRHGQSLGLSYPNPADAHAALAEGRIDSATHAAILLAYKEGRRPPWGSPLGGEIYIHAGGIHSDWTQGCIALRQEDMARLFSLAALISLVEILP